MERSNLGLSLFTFVPSKQFLNRINCGLHWHPNLIIRVEGDHYKQVDQHQPTNDIFSVTDLTVAKFHLFGCQFH